MTALVKLLQRILKFVLTSSKKNLIGPQWASLRFSKCDKNVKSIDRRQLSPTKKQI